MSPKVSSGKRQARRVRAAERRLQSGDLAPEDVPEQYGLEGYTLHLETLTLHPPQSDALSAFDPEVIAEPVIVPDPGSPPLSITVDFQPTTGPFPRVVADRRQPWAPSIGSLDLSAYSSKKPRVSHQEPSSSSSAPQPSSSSSALAPSEPVTAPDPFQGIIVSFDLHKTIDDSTWWGEIPSVHRNILQRLVDKGVSLLICSYIGRSLGEGEEKERQSQETRDHARAVVSQLASDLGLAYTEKLYQGLRPDFLTFVIVNSKKWKAGKKEQGPFNGKISCLAHFGAHVHFDDKIEVHAEISKYGFVPYHHLTDSREGKKKFYLGTLEKAGYSHPSSSSFVESFKAFEKDVVDGIFWQKWSILQDIKLPFSL